ncbi:ABC-type transport system involved in resistance to organic solvents, periplasmic component [invertebrate metagenome]|uniref:ABC-type transport system involved in resistance to organic solvents, periplasmic component n=1 Tax=invertebrate metagenome TaxID=1711999 RepID=A0A484HA03_9ZZZZ
MGRNPVETILGAVVLLVAVCFLAFAYATSAVLPVQGYPLKAVFAKIGGLQAGADVRISGIKVGAVTAQTLDPVTFEAVVHMSIMPDVHLPRDTIASIASEGLLGGKYVRLEPGHIGTYLAAGDTVTETKDFRSLEETVSEIIFLATKSSDSLR